MIPRFTSIAALALAAGAAAAQARQADEPMIFDYDTMAGMNAGLTQAQYDVFDTDLDGVLDADEQMMFTEAGYTNETQVELLEQPTDDQSRIGD